MFPLPAEEQIVRRLFEIASQFYFLEFATVVLGVIVPWLVVGWFVFLLLQLKSFKLKFYYFALATLSIIISRGIIAEIARHIFYSPRPSVFFDMASIIPHALTGGMPSGHMAILIPLILVCIFINKKFIFFAVTLVLLVGAARVAGGAHWISDIVVGVIIGAIGFLIAKIILPKKSAIGYIEPIEADEVKILV